MPREDVTCLEAVDLERYRWLVRVNLTIPDARAQEISNLCSQFGWGIRSADFSDTEARRDQCSVAIDIPMIGVKFGVCKSASRRALTRLGRTGIPLCLEKAAIIEPIRQEKAREYSIYKAFPENPAGSEPTLWYRFCVYAGARDHGSIFMHAGEERTVASLELMRRLRLRKGLHLLGPDDLVAGPTIKPMPSRKLPLVLVVLIPCVVGIVVFLLAPTPLGATHARLAWLAALSIFIVGGVYQFARNRSPVSLVLGMIPIGLSLLPPVKQTVAKGRIDAYLQPFGLSSAYAVYEPGGTLTATLQPLAITIAASGFVFAAYGWLRYFMHSQYRFEWVFVAFLALFYMLTAVVVAQQDGHRQGIQAVAATRSSHVVPDIFGYQPKVACLAPLAPRIAFQGVSLPTGRPVLVFGASQGQTAVWDPQTGQPTLVSTGDVQILHVASSASACAD